MPHVRLNQLGMVCARCLCAVLAVLSATLLRGETGYRAWLRYAPLEASKARSIRSDFPAAVLPLSHGLLIRSAEQELIRGAGGMLGQKLRVESSLHGESAVVLGIMDDVHRAIPQFDLSDKLPPDGYLLKTVPAGKARYLVVAGANERGVLYGVFVLLRKIALGESIRNLDEQESPYAPIRWVNQWDNLDGSIERGYGGRSIFWEGGRARSDLSRVNDYGRLLAALGINGCSINNVNADPKVLSSDFLPEVARIAGALRPWGVQVVLAVDLGSPKILGGLNTFDPLDPRVGAWWKAKADELYAAVPDLAGFVMKADSEGRAGPSAYGRTHADAANTVARALAPHGGLLFYRAFVYDHHLDWRNLKNDRARAAYDNFHPLDGRFDSNVVIQIKNGPIDFQVREPASPLFGGLEKTNQAVELQITEEYTGQARHLVFLVPMWKATLDFDMHTPRAATPVKALVRGKAFDRQVGGFVGVANVGLDDNWAGSQISPANLYGFGRLAWNPNLSAERIAEEWTRLTFGNDPKAVAAISKMLVGSWRAYEDYTGPLGLQTLTDITGNHYGPAVEASEKNGWGQWHRADAEGAGMDRTVATGTGFAGQYASPVAAMFESLATCPDDLVLFFHHLPYTARLHSGETVIQSIYDLHYRGAESVAEYVRDWRSLEGRVDVERYRQVLAQLEYQAGATELWRDAVANWFLRASGIPDAKGRVGHYPGRLEAEKMTLEGYTVTPVTPREDASGGEAVECHKAKCSAQFTWQGARGRYDLGVRYFDQNNGVSHFRLFVGSLLVGEWDADDHLPTAKVDGSSSTIRTFAGVALRMGDSIRIEGKPDGGERAAIDYVEIEPAQTRIAAEEHKK